MSSPAAVDRRDRELRHRERTLSDTDWGMQRKRLTKHRHRNASSGDATSTSSGERERHAAFMWSNERRVDDVVLGFFYKSHTLTLLALVIAALVYLALTSNDSTTEENIWRGCKAMFFFFLTTSVLIFPNGPFTRPHPAFWRVAFGLSIIYWIVLVFVCFQSYADVKAALKWLDPEGLGQWESADANKDYAVNCSDVTIARIYDSLDLFAFAHFFGWAMKALLLRNTFILWYISITWELTEVLFSHLLPNFQECWWDSLILDIFICNGLGIAFGMWVANKLEMREYRWESLVNISSTRGKVKRAVMQFTPENWMSVRWFEAHSSFMRTLLTFAMVVTWETIELNTFFLKHILAIDTNHPIVAGRIMLIAICGAPTIRQYYLYVTDARAQRMGTQCWVYVAVTLTEAIICIKFGPQVFAKTQIWLIIGWLAMLVVGAVLCVYLSVQYAKHSSKTRDTVINGRTEQIYLDSSHENIPALIAASAHGHRAGSTRYKKET